MMIFSFLKQSCLNTWKFSPMQCGYNRNWIQNWKVKSVSCLSSSSRAVPKGQPLIKLSLSKAFFIKKAECQKIDAFELWCWRRLLRVPWTARRFNQSILKENSPEYSLEGLMLKLKLQYFGHLMWRAVSFEKTLMLGKIEGRRGSRWQRMRCLDGITNSMDMRLGELSRN